MTIPSAQVVSLDRATLVDARTKLMAIVEADRASRAKYGLKHDSPYARKLLNRIWNLDETIMKLTSATKATP